MKTHSRLFSRLLSCCLFLCACALFGQEVELWSMNYAQDGHATNVPVAMVVDNESNIYVTGYTRDAGLSNGWVTLKYSYLGTLDWAVYYGGSTNGDQPAAIALSPNGDHIYVTGFAYGTGSDSDFATVAYDSAGAKLWERRYNGAGNGPDQAKAMAVDQAGNVYVAGTAYLSTSVINGRTCVNMSYITVKYDPNGSQLWVRGYAPTSNNQDAQALALDSAGNIYVGGISVFAPDPRAPGFGFGVVKYAPDGTQLTALRYDGSSGNGTSANITLAIGPANELYVAGTIWPYTVVPRYNLLKYTNDVQAWAQTYYGANPYGTDYNHVQALAVDQQGNAYVCGSGPNLSNITECVTMKYNPSGTQLWVVTHNRTRTNNEYARAMALDAAGNLCVTAWSKGESNSSAFETIQYSPAGAVLWEAAYEGLGGGLNEPKAMAIHPKGVLVTGASASLSGLNFATVCYAQQTYYAILSNGCISFRCTAAPGSTNWLQTSTDLKSWIDVSSGLAGADGVCIFPDQSCNSACPKAFYRVRYH